MKHQHAMIAIAGLCLSLTACGDATTDAQLPVGVAPVSSRADNPAPTEPKTLPTPVVREDEARYGGADQEFVLPLKDLGIDEPVLLSFDAERKTIDGMSYVLPEGWSVGAKKQMRLLTLIPPDDFADAELAVSRWPGDVGGFSANVTRWARQLGMQPPDKARKDYKQVKVGDTQSAFIELVNQDSGKAILALWVPRGDDPDKPKETWTLKLTCQAKHAEALAKDMLKWAESIQFD